MSTLLKTVKRSSNTHKQSNNILKDLFKISAKEGIETNKFSVLFIFTSDAKRDLTSTQVAFLHKFYCYFLAGDQ